MNAINFMDAHRFALNGLVIWLVINVQAVRFMARAKGTFEPPTSAIDGMSATITQHPT